jgi:hypothetical protein
VLKVTPGYHYRLHELDQNAIVEHAMWRKFIGKKRKYDEYEPQNLSFLNDFLNK